MTDVITAPHSPTAEQSLLGALIIDYELIRRINLQPDDFYIRRNGFIYAAIQDIVRGGGQADMITVCARLDAQGHLAEVGGPAYIMELITVPQTSINAESYAAVVRERAYRRNVIGIAQKLATEAYRLDSDISTAVSGALDSLARTVITDRGAVHLSTYASKIMDEVERAMSNPQDMYGIPTGFLDWDAITFGLHKGEKLVISGEPGVGKSILAMQVLLNAAERGHPGALYELEMSGEQVARRGLSGMSRIATQRLRQGKLTDDEASAFVAAVERMEKLPVYMSDKSGLTTGELRADLIRLKEYFGVELAVIDYEGLLCDAPDKPFFDRSTLISARVHDIAKDLDIAVISISDMNKSGIAGDTKGQAAVAGTARVLHDADQITVIRKTDRQEVVRMTWEKMREGDPNRFIDLVRINGFPMFGSIERRK